MGLANEHGRGVAVNKTSALEWYKGAADHGDSYAAAEIGDAYLFGRGSARD
jgi:TPR repeat protein